MEQDLKDKLANCQYALNGKVQELELVRKEQNVELTLKDSKHQMELQEERDKLISVSFLLNLYYILVTCIYTVKPPKHTLPNNRPSI